MRIVFMGTPEFAVPTLARLIADGHNIPAVYTQPDKPSGRGYKLAPPPVKALALENGIPVRQPKTLRDEAVLQELCAFAPELILVVAYGRILPKAVLELPARGCMNLHASLLPKYRGAAPIQWSIVNGETRTGVTSMVMAQGIDTGDILLQDETQIGENERAPELAERLSALGAQCVANTIERMLGGDLPRAAQDDASATIAPILKKEDGQIDFERPAREIHNLVRGLAGWPNAYSYLDGKLFKVHSTLIQETPGTSAAPGEMYLDGERLLVGCAQGALELGEVQLEGKQRMRAVDFWRGYSGHLQGGRNAHAKFMNR